MRNFLLTLLICGVGFQSSASAATGSTFRACFENAIREQLADTSDEIFRLDSDPSWRFRFTFGTQPNYHFSGTVGPDAVSGTIHFTYRFFPEYRLVTRLGEGIVNEAFYSCGVDWASACRDVAALRVLSSNGRFLFSRNGTAACTLDGTNRGMETFLGTSHVR